MVAVGEEGSSASDSPSYDSIVPFIFGIGCEFLGVVFIHIFWDEVFSCENKDKDYDHLVDGLADDVLQHCFGNDVFVS